MNYTGPLNTKHTCTYTNKYIKLLHTRPATIHGARNGVHSTAFKVEYPVLWTVIVFWRETANGVQIWMTIEVEWLIVGVFPTRDNYGNHDHIYCRSQ